jgi:hypothetical protein
MKDLKIKQTHTLWEKNVFEVEELTTKKDFTKTNN